MASVNQGPFEPCFTPLEPRFEHDSPDPVLLETAEAWKAKRDAPQYHVFAETRAQVENSTDPRSIGSYDGNALKALEYVAHCLDQDAEIIVIQRMRP